MKTGATRTGGVPHCSVTTEKRHHKVHGFNSKVYYPPSSRHDSEGAFSFSFPFREGGPPFPTPNKLGELAFPAAFMLKEVSLRPPLGGAIEGNEAAEGEPMLFRGGAGCELLFCPCDSPDAASVRRNSTQRREKD